MSGAMSRRKGANYERELARKFAEAMPGAKVERGLQYRSGQDAPDVECPGLWIESKRGKKPNVRAALKQALAASPGHRLCVAVIRDDRAEPFIGMMLDDFLELVREWWELKNR